jgi:ABC-type xylose transport system permease subunit
MAKLKDLASNGKGRRSISTSFDGRTIVLYVVATAVIGCASLFGGRGHPLHAVLGGLVIAGIVNWRFSACPRQSS